MNLSIKSVGFSGQQVSNSYSNNIGCQPLSPHLFKIPFGDGGSQMIVNDHGDSFLKNGKESSQEKPLSFGQRFKEAAKQVSRDFKDGDPATVAKNLGKALYGANIN